MLVAKSIFTTVAIEAGSEWVSDKLPPSSPVCWRSSSFKYSNKSRGDFCASVKEAVNLSLRKCEANLAPDVSPNAGIDFKLVVPSKTASQIWSLTLADANASSFGLPSELATVQVLRRKFKS